MQAGKFIAPTYSAALSSFSAKYRATVYEAKTTKTGLPSEEKVQPQDSVGPLVQFNPTDKEFTMDELEKTQE